MPEEQGVYRIVNGKRYVFPDEEKAKAYDAARLSIMQQRADQEGLLSQAVIGAKSIIPGAIRGAGLAATGIGSVFDLEAARKAGEYLEEKAKQTSEAFIEPYQRYTKGAMLGETAGGIIPGIAATAATVAAVPETGGASLALLPAVVGGLFGAAQGAGEVGSDIREARARGVQVSPEQERNLALIQGGITGILEGGIAGKVAKGIRGIATAGRLAAAPLWRSPKRGWVSRRRRLNRRRSTAIAEHSGARRHLCAWTWVRSRTCVARRSTGICSCWWCFWWCAWWRH